MGGSPTETSHMSGTLAAAIRRRIVSGELVEGAALPPEHVLLDQFNVSRPTVREALRLLEQEQLIFIKRGAGGGPRVRRPSPEAAARYAGSLLQLQQTTLAQVYQARALVEQSAIELLDSTRLAECVAALQDNLVEAEKRLAGNATEDLIRLPELSRQFHQIVVKASGNPAIHLLTDVLSEVVQVGESAYVTDQVGREVRAEVSQTSVRSHRLLLTLLEGGELEAADAMWRRHVSETQRMLTEAAGGDRTLLDLVP